RGRGRRPPLGCDRPGANRGDAGDRPGPRGGRGRDRRGGRARDDARTGLLRRHGRPARSWRGGLMRSGIVVTVLRREWAETGRNRLLMSTIMLPPVILTIAPLVLAGVVGDRALPPQLADQVLAQR